MLEGFVVVSFSPLGCFSIFAETWKAKAHMSFNSERVKGHGRCAHVFDMNGSSVNSKSLATLVIFQSLREALN